jgi:hypothetical protein
MKTKFYCKLILPLPRKSANPRAGVLARLIALSREMEIGDAVALTLSESQTMRIILQAQGHQCATDGWRCPEPGKTLVFKLP